MKLTDTNDEDEAVRMRLKSLPIKLTDAQIKKVLMPGHLFYRRLLNDDRYEAIRKALEAISIYRNGYYLGKATKMLIQPSNDPVQYDANIAEMVAAGYYMHKFSDDDNAIEWVRKPVTGSLKSVDITIHKYRVPINIEVTGLNDPKNIRDFFAVNARIRDRIKEAVIDTENPKYLYVYDIEKPSGNTGSASTDYSVLDEHLEEFIQFIREKKVSGPGEYEFRFNDTHVANLNIFPLNSSRDEYVDDMSMFGGWARDGLRIATKVIEKAEGQLPEGEINFVYVVNLSSLEREDYIEAMHGQFQAKVSVTGNKPEVVDYRYADDGVSGRAQESGLSNINGIIGSQFDYFNLSSRLIVRNPRQSVPEEVYELVS